MADTVSSVKAYESPRRGEYVYRYTNRSDGTGESAVIKIDVSSLENADGDSGSLVTIDRIDWTVSGMDYVHVYWDRTSDVTIGVLSGAGSEDYSHFGGFTDSGTGGTGDVVFTTENAVSGGSYDITIHFTVN